MGMKGYDPGGNEWPTKRTFTQIGGSMSSLTASSYLDFFIEPRSVLVLDMLLLVIFALAYF